MHISNILTLQYWGGNWRLLSKAKVAFFGTPFINKQTDKLMTKYYFVLNLTGKCNYRFNIKEDF